MAVLHLLWSPENLILHTCFDCDLHTASSRVQANVSKRKDGILNRL
jgi:hypothetical protein